MLTNRTTRICNVLILFLGLFFATTVYSQSRFSPVVQVGEKVITRYQLDQRTLFLSLLGAPGDPRDLAKEQLINESLQLDAAKAAGIEPSEEEVASGSNEFAGRANLTGDEFLKALAANGIQGETFRDFITAGVAWRTFVRDQLAVAARDFPDSLIERRLAERGTEGGLRVLVSEVMLPAATPETARASRARAATVSALTSEEAFSAAAREMSVAASSARGGELEWIALEALPSNIQTIISALNPGQISRPVDLENAIGVFLLRDVERVAAGTPETVLVDYALFLVDGGMNEARFVRAEVDTCDDLYGVARGLPENRLIRETLNPSELPADVRREVANLDSNEISTALTRNGQATVLMLCSRLPALESSVDRNIVGNRILNNRLAVVSADYLTQLRAKTNVVDLSQ